MSDKPPLTLVIHYNDDLDPLHPQNRKAAKVLGWKYDKDWHAYRDTCGFALVDGAAPQYNNVDCWR